MLLFLYLVAYLDKTNIGASLAVTCVMLTPFADNK